MLNILQKSLLLILFVFFSVFNAKSQGKKLEGFIYDSENREPVIGASVWIKELNKGDVTDLDGYFTVHIDEDKACKLVVTSVTYKALEIDYVPNSTILPLNIFLQTETFDIGEVEIRGRMGANTENTMMMTVKSQMQVSSGVSAAQISRSPDRVASEVVRRVPGVTVIDDRFIIVRGLSQRYNNAWINGLAVPSTETDSRAFPLDLVPSSQIDNLLIFKSPSPEVPGDFSGGFVKITSKGVPDENRIEAGYTTGFNVNTQFDNFRYNPGSATDFLGFDDGKRSLSNGLNKDWSIQSKTPLPDQRLSLMIARRMERKNGEAVGNVTAITYSNTFKSIEKMKNARFGIYSSISDAPVYLDNYLDNQFSNDARLGVMHNWAFPISSYSRIEFKNLLNILGRNRLTERSGIKDMSSMYYREQTELQYTSRLTYTGQFSGTHDLSPNKTLTWDAGYSFANKNEPDRRIVTNHAGVGSMEDIASVTTINYDIRRYFQDLADHTFSAALNYRQTFKLGDFKPTLKTGFYGEYRKRDYNNREFIYRYDKLRDILTHEEFQSYLKMPFNQMLDEQYTGNDKVYLDEITNKTNNYSATVNHIAGYAAFEFPVNRLSIYTGLRVENHYTRLTRDRSNSPDLTLINHKNIHDLNLLPSVNLIYKFSEKQQLRFAYGLSVNRPELREISPSVYFDFDLFSEIGGNENLKTATINNVDLRYEFYPSQGETVSFGAFYKHFRNPVEWTFIDMGGTLRYVYENADLADSYGIEMEVRKKLDFISLPDFTLMLNAALIESNVHFKTGEVMTEPDRPLQGQSPYIINAGLYYRSEKIGCDVSLLYNRIGKRIVGLGKSNTIEHSINSLIPDSYEMPRNTLDFTLSKKIGKNVEIRCSVKDILSENVVFKQFPKFEKDGIINCREQITRQYNPGQSVSLGINIKLN
ncbi:MAG: outer membrane beta-barrel protein [Dysgonamonadaceae bacterium]|jgi:outer membrane receptor for ferrienterochelin and colicin|nr:outer membrane beta-barrel protein [Dysgonamonadaceae bacterium]